MSIKFLVLGGGGNLGFGGGESADFIFMGARIFLTKFPADTLLAPPPRAPLLENTPPLLGFSIKKLTPAPSWRLELPLPLPQAEKKIKNIRNVHQVSNEADMSGNAETLPSSNKKYLGGTSAERNSPRNKFNPRRKNGTKARQRRLQNVFENC